MILAASSIHVTVGEVAAALALVAIAAIASRSWQAGLEEDIGIAVVRSFVQLTAIGYVITVIFDAGLRVARPRPDHRDGRVRRLHRPPAGPARCPNAFWPLLVSLAVAAAATLGLVVGARHLPRDAALPGPGRRDGDRQLDDRRGRGAQPARRGRPRAGPADRGDAGARRDLLAGGRRRSSAAACARG